MNEKTIRLLKSPKSLDNRHQGSNLVMRDPVTLYCEETDVEYPIIDGVPILLPLFSPYVSGKYDNRDMVERYISMHYGAFSYASLSILDEQDPDSPIANLIKLVDYRNQTQNHTHLYDAYFEMLRHPNPTEEFYQLLLAIVKDYIMSGMIVVDAGCAVGRMTFEFARLGAGLVLGFDLSHMMLVRAIRIAQNSGKHYLRQIVPTQVTTIAKEFQFNVTGNFDFAVADATNLPLWDNSVDIVTSLNVIDRVEKPLELVSEAQRILKPGGYFIITDPYDWNAQLSKPETWVTDFKSWFSPDLWQLERDVDAVPFMIWRSPRNFVCYVNQVAVFKKLA